MKKDIAVSEVTTPRCHHSLYNIVECLDEAQDANVTKEKNKSIYCQLVSCTIIIRGPY